MAALLPLRPGQSVLEIGFGPCWLTRLAPGWPSAVWSVETRAFRILMLGIDSETSDSRPRPAQFQTRVSDDAGRACRPSPW